MNEIEYLLGDEQDEEKTDRELSEEELEAVAGGRKAQKIDKAVLGAEVFDAEDRAVDKAQDKGAHRADLND